MGIVFLVIGAPFMAFSYYSVYNKNKEAFIKLDFRKFIRDYDAERYILSAMKLVEQKGIKCFWL